MRKQLFMTTAMAASLTALSACSSNDGWNEDVVADRDVAVCVNQQGTRVDDDLCDHNQYSGGGSNAFLWYYLGRNSRVPYYGDSIHDRRFANAGSYVPSTLASYARAPVESRMTRSQAVSRGGLGSMARSFGGGRS